MLPTACLLTNTLYGIASRKYNKQVGLRAPCKDTATAFVSGQEAETVMLYRAKVIGSVPVRDQAVAGIAKRRLLSLPTRSVSASNKTQTDRRFVALVVAALAADDQLPVWKSILLASALS